MAKYYFEITLRNQSKMKVILPELESMKLHEIDGYALHKGFLTMCEKLAEQARINSRDIEVVKIARDVKNQYNLITDNKYLEKIVNEVGEIEIENEFGKKVLENVVPFDNPEFVEMKTYLLDTLENNSTNFFMGYKYINKFGKLLNEYSQGYNNGYFESGEDEHKSNLLKNEIVNKLRIYRNFRAIAMHRTKHETRSYYIPSTEYEKIANITVFDHLNWTDVKLPEYTYELDLNKIRIEFPDYEFLTDDELGQMYNDDPEKVDLYEGLEENYIQELTGGDNGKRFR